MMHRVLCIGAQQERSLKERKVRPSIALTNEWYSACIYTDHSSPVFALDSHLTKIGMFEFCGIKTSIWRTKSAAVNEARHECLLLDNAFTDVPFVSCSDMSTPTHGRSTDLVYIARHRSPLTTDINGYLQHLLSIGGEFVPR